MTFLKISPGMQTTYIEYEHTIQILKVWVDKHESNHNGVRHTGR